MIKNIIIAAIGIIVVIAVGVFLYVTRPPSAPSQDVNAVVDDANPPSASDRVYRISRENSEVEFRINEVLRGSPTTAVGTTREVAGDITVSDETISVGRLAVNARTFRTDSERRDGAISRAILKSEDPANEFIYFEPTEISGLPDELEDGESVNFVVIGDLTIAGVTRPGSFNVNLRFDENTMTGTATTIVKRSDFNLVIPSVSFVASVDDEVNITADITANRVQ